MIRTTLHSALCLCLSPLLVAQQSSSSAQSPTPSELVANEHAATTTLRRGTIVALALMDTISSATAHEGQTVRLALAEDVIVKGAVVIRRGAPAVGVIESVRKATDGKHGGDLQVKLVSFTPPGTSPIALKDYTPPTTDSDGFCGGFISCLFVFVVLVIPYWTVAGIVDAVKAPFHRHHTSVAGKDLVLSPCLEISGKTVASSQIDNALPNPFQLQTAIDFDAICPRRTGPGTFRLSRRSPSGRLVPMLIAAKT